MQPFSLQLQGYVGVSVSPGFISPDLPVGIAAGITIKSKPSKKPWLLSEDQQQRIGSESHAALIFFLQAFDAGNPFAVSTQQTVGGKTLSRLYWSSLFNPGASIGFGFKNMPLAVLGGITYNENPSHQRTIMAKLSVNLDVPIWHLWNN
jgi:hypothetical protein